MLRKFLFTGYLASIVLVPSALAESATHQILSGAEKSINDANDKQNKALEQAKRDLDESVNESKEFQESEDDLQRTRRELEEVDSLDGDEQAPIE